MTLSVVSTWRRNMVSWPRRLRTIRRSPLFESSVEDLASVRRLDEILEGVEWALANDPERFTEVPHTTLRVIPTDPFVNIPALRIYYRIEDDDHVCLEWAEPIDGAIDDEEDYS